MKHDIATSSPIDFNAVDVILDSFAKAAANPATERAVFYNAINQQLVAVTESLASLIVAKNREGQVRVLGQAGWDALPTATSNQVKQLMKRLFAQSSPEIHTNVDSALSQVKVYPGRARPRNGLELIYLLIREPGDPALSQQVFGDLAAEIANQLETFENLQTAERKPQSVEELSAITQLLQNMGKSNGLLELAFHFVNDAAKITQADRVSLLNPAGKVLAISGVSNVSARTSFSRALSTVARLTLASRGSVEWTGGELIADGKRMPRGLSAAIKQLATPSGFAIPIKSDHQISAVAMLEYLPTDGRDHAVERRELINETINFASPVLTRSLNLNSIPAIGKLDFFYNRLLVRPIRSLISIGLVMGLLCGCLYGLFGVQRAFEISAQGVLHASDKHHVFSPIEGEVESLLVAEGSHVARGDTVALLKSAEIDQEAVTVGGELAEARQQLHGLILSENFDPTEQNSEDRLTQIASETERLKIRIATLESRQQFLEDKRERATIVAPMDGQITTPNLEQRLTARPLNRGDVLMTISQTAGEWELELLIPDHCVEFIQAAQQQHPNEPVAVKFRLASSSSQIFQGQLREIDFRTTADPTNEMTYATARVDLDENELGDALRLGTRVFGKFECGSESNFFLLTYEIRSKLREWWFF